MRLNGLSYHLTRLTHELGRRLTLGGRDYRVRGYLPNGLTTSFRHERHLVAPLERALAARPGLFVDVGVNTGQTLLKVLATDPSRPYLGFEPQIGCCFYVDQFLRDNRIGNARILCLALSDENRLLPIYAEGQMDEMASLIAQDARGHHAAVRSHIPVRVGDEALAELGAEAPAIVKVDVEGAEISVFRGLARTIAAARPICFFEVLPNFVGEARDPIAADAAARNRATARDLMTFFMAAGYGVRQIDQAGAERPIAGFDLDTPAAYAGSDYVAYPAG